MLALVKGEQGSDIGKRPTFADIGESVAKHLGISAGENGKSFL